MIPYYDQTKWHLWGNDDGPVFITGWDGLTKCIYCGAMLVRGDLRDHVDTGEYEKRLASESRGIGRFRYYSCARCGWWQVEEGINDWDSKDYGHQNYHRAILKHFDITSKLAPLKAVADYLAKNEEAVFSLHHEKMEHLVAAVFREHFSCEVRHCGRTGDRGIDLLIVRTEDELIPVQVKRRMAPGKSEPVKTVREMMGVMLRDNYKRAFVVSTADRYTSSAEEDVQTVLDSGRAEAIELVDRASFLAILREHFGEPQNDFARCGRRVVLPRG